MFLTHGHYNLSSRDILSSVWICYRIGLRLSTETIHDDDVRRRRDGVASFDRGGQATIHGVQETMAVDGIEGGGRVWRTAGSEDVATTAIDTSASRRWRVGSREGARRG